MTDPRPSGAPSAAPSLVSPPASSRGPSAASLPAVLDLVDRAREALLDSCRSTAASQRYAGAQLGALRSAAALLAARPPGPHASRRSAPRNVWQSVTRAAPELQEWSQFFALTSERAAASASGRAPVSGREADDLLRQAEMFMELVLARLGLPLQLPLPACSPPLRRS